MSRHAVQSLFPDIRPEKFAGPLFPSVMTGTNAQLIAKIAATYLTGSVLDTTYGEFGGWWKRYIPDPFTWHDLAIDGVDFRDLPHADGEFDAVCFDPPYVPAGGERDSGSTAEEADFRRRFGIGYTEEHAPKGRAELVALINDGLDECTRVLAPTGFLLVKCTDYTDGGRLCLGQKDVFDAVDRHMADAADTTKPEGDRLSPLFVHDFIVHHTGSGPGGHNIEVQRRARRHHSYLIVLTKVDMRS